MMEALTNPVILEHIFSKLSLSDLKTSRLVCREWDDVAASLLGRSTFLNVNKVFPFDPANLYEMVRNGSIHEMFRNASINEMPRNAGNAITSVNDKLKQCLLISDHRQSLIPTDNRFNIFTQMMTQTQDISQVIREIKLFFVSQKQFAVSFLKWIAVLKITSIQHVSISISEKARILQDEDPVQEYPKLPIQANLTSIKFTCPDAKQEILPVYETFFQILIDSAPNLTSLDITGIFYPNLERSKKLEVLEFRFHHWSHSAPTKLDLTILANILAQVKDSLTELKFGYIGNENIDLLVRIRNFLDETHLPKLKNLTFSKSGYGNSIYSNLWQRHRGVQYVNVTWSLNSPGEFGKTVVQLFPAVKKFDFTLWSCGGNLIQNINNILEPLAMWDLKEANVVVHRVEESSVLVEIVKNMENWKGIKRVHFVDAEIKYDDFSPRIPDLIRYGKGFKSIKISGNENYVFMDPGLVELMRPTFEASGAPIHVTGGVARRCT
ncbi:hypothetical protein Fcan01_17966 [Folsomia candida]|uniref:F-box domain-containing protein n=1 Tax=Folsomia candida TaxID=158441 RepID=A0A226DQC2_FOLCA|nr:hypothetical protein Fcan01_17966 [Folsomia candida]